MKTHERGVAAAVLTSALTVLIGLLAIEIGPASAVTSSPSPTASASSTATSSSTPTPSPTPTPAKPAAGADTAWGTPGQTSVVHVLVNDSCGGSTAPPCAYSSLKKFIVAGVTDVKGVTAVAKSDGTIRVSVASTVPIPTTATVKYAFQDAYGSAPGTITFHVGHAPVTPNTGVSVYIGKSKAFDLLARVKCQDLTTPCPTSGTRLTLGTQTAFPNVTARVSSPGVVTVSVGPKQPLFSGHAHIPYKVTDKYGSSSGIIVVTSLDAYAPHSGWVYNQPLGTPNQKQAIYNRMVTMINHAPKGAVVELMTYALDGDALVNALVNAKRRGVATRVIQSQGLILGQVPYLQSQLGTDPRANNFYYICKYACRAGNSGMEHSKVLGISKSGLATNLVMSSSSNWSWGGGQVQWTDAYLSVNNATAFRTFSTMYGEARHDRRPYPDWTGITKQANPILTYIYPITIRTLAEINGTKPATVTAPAKSGHDWVEVALSQISCKAAAPYGHNGRTVIRVNVRAIYGARGYDIGYQLAQLSKAGCDVHVITNGINPDATRVMQQAGIPVQDMTWYWSLSTCYTTDGKPIAGTKCWEPGVYDHFHAMAVSGSYQGKNQALVWSGSEGWNTDSYYNDEQWVRVGGAASYSAYMAQWNYAWQHWVHAVGQHPAGGPTR